MRKNLTFIIALAFLLVLLPSVNATLCYQETANVSTACGGLGTGTYKYNNSFWTNSGKVIDENWSTYGGASSYDPAPMYVNYSKAINSLGSSLWQVKDSNNTINLSMPTGCWNQNPLEFEINSINNPPGGTDNAVWSCWNGTDWQLLRQSHYTGFGNYNVYEEAMWWNNTITTELNQSYNLNVLEGSNQQFNITIKQSDNLTTLTPLFSYNGTSYTTGITTTISGTNTTFSKIITVPLMVMAPLDEYLDEYENRFFYWNITTSYGGSSSTNQSTSYNQTVYSMQMRNTTAGGWTNIMNFTCLDEFLLTPVNCTTVISFQTWSPDNYGVAGVSRLYSWTENSGKYSVKRYWKKPIDMDFKSLVTVNAYAVGYPQRIFTYTNQPLTNTSVNQNILLLSSASGMYISFQVVTVGGSVIQGAEVKVEIDINGTNTTILDQLTDGAGIASTFLSINYDYTLTVIKTGFTTQVQTIHPSQPIYTITLGGSSHPFLYNGTSIEGITYTFWPPSGMINEGLYNYTFYVNSSLNNIYNCSMRVYYMNGTLFSSASGCNSTYPSMGSGGQIYTGLINTSATGRLFGTYIISVSNGTSGGPSNFAVLVLDADAQWVLVNNSNYSQNYFATLQQALYDLTNLPEWGGACGSGYYLNTTQYYPQSWPVLGGQPNYAYMWCCPNGNIFCVPSQFTNGTSISGSNAYWNQTSDFSRIVFFFLFISIIFAIINFYTGFDTAYPGSFLYFITIIVLIMTCFSGATGGFFDLIGAFSPFGFFGSFAVIADNWIIAFMFILLSFIYFWTTNRRYSTG